MPISCLQPRPLSQYPASLCLLSCHGQSHLSFGVFDQVAAHIHGHTVDLAGKLERRRVLRRDGQARVGATGQATRVEDNWRGIWDIGVSDQSAIDIKLASPRRALAMWDVWLAGWLELEAQLVASLRHCFL